MFMYMSIQPVDLLSKSYEQFVADSSHLGLHKDALQLVYKEYDEERLRKEFGDIHIVRCFQRKKCFCMVSER